MTSALGRYHARSRGLRDLFEPYICLTTASVSRLEELDGTWPLWNSVVSILGTDPDQRCRILRKDVDFQSSSQTVPSVPRDEKHSDVRDMLHNFKDMLQDIRSTKLCFRCTLFPLLVQLDPSFGRLGKRTHVFVYCGLEQPSCFEHSGVHLHSHFEVTDS